VPQADPPTLWLECNSGRLEWKVFRKTSASFAEPLVDLMDLQLAFRLYNGIDLLTKHHRPRTLKDALKQSSRGAANENKPQKKRRS
jgi:hypothetical protein